MPDKRQQKFDFDGGFGKKPKPEPYQPGPRPPPPLWKGVLAWVSWLWWRAWKASRRPLQHFLVRTLLWVLLLLALAALGIRVLNVRFDRDGWSIEFRKPSPKNPWEPKIERAR